LAQRLEGGGSKHLSNIYVHVVDSEDADGIWDGDSQKAEREAGGKNLSHNVFNVYCFIASVFHLGFHLHSPLHGLLLTAYFLHPAAAFGLRIDTASIL
jgi:hypothetical protein